MMANLNRYRPTPEQREIDMRAFEARFGARLSSDPAQIARSVVLYGVYGRRESNFWMWLEGLTGAIRSQEIEAGSFNRNKITLKKGSTVFILCNDVQARNRLYAILHHKQYG